MGQKRKSRGSGCPLPLNKSAKLSADTLLLAEEACPKRLGPGVDNTVYTASHHRKKDHPRLLLIPLKARERTVCPDLVFH